jgi:hypothetical protein
MERRAGTTLSDDWTMHSRKQKEPVNGIRRLLTAGSDNNLLELQKKARSVLPMYDQGRTGRAFSEARDSTSSWLFLNPAHQG